MEYIVDRFKRYISVDTQSDEFSDTTPSTEKQYDLARMLRDELEAMGVSNVRLDEDRCYVYGMIPANTDTDRSIGFISHMDTASAAPGDASGCRIVKNYDGNVVVLKSGVRLDPEVFPEMLYYKGQDLIVTDGVSLLGSDDKAGVAEIMTMAERIMNDPSIKHGKIGIGFTPDEEVGRGADYFDIDGFGVDFAYTVDGGELGEIEYENFNAAAAVVSIHGADIHPGYAKDKMINAARVAIEFDRFLPQNMRPEYTENYDGFFHLTDMFGDASDAQIRYIIRDHDEALFNKKKEIMYKAAEYLNTRYREDAVKVEITDTYKNMKELILPHMHLIDDAVKAFEACGVEPKIVPIRGGTDGARLTYEGLPCPNLSTGGMNFHSNTEYIPVQSLEKMADVLVELVTIK